MRGPTKCAPGNLFTEAWKFPGLCYCTDPPGKNVTFQSVWTNFQVVALDGHAGHAARRKFPVRQNPFYAHTWSSWSGGGAHLPLLELGRAGKEEVGASPTSTGIREREQRGLLGCIWSVPQVQNVSRVDSGLEVLLLQVYGQFLQIALAQ